MAKAKKTIKNQNQHYVPEFYQRHFIEDGSGKIWVYIPGGVEPSHKGVGETAATNNTYAYHTGGKKEILAVEKELGAIEGTSGTLIKDYILSEKPLTEEFKGPFSTFLVSQHRRTLKHRDIRQKPLADEVVAELFEDNNFEKEVINALKATYPNADIVELAWRLKGLRPTMERAQQEYQSKTPDFLFPQLAAAKRSLGPEILCKMCWVVWKAPANHPFITSDDPVIMTNGLAKADAMLLYPITKKYFLQIFWGTADKDYFDVTPEQVDHLNEQIMRCSAGEVYSGRKTTELQEKVDQFVKSPYPREVTCEVRSPDGRVFSQAVPLSLQESTKLGRSHEMARSKVLAGVPAYQVTLQKLRDDATAWKAYLDSLPGDRGGTH